MNRIVTKLINDNPEFTHHLCDDSECREFIKKNFDFKILYAYDCLIPGAYKADLWRYCILYKMGGIYVDIKFQCINGFKLIELTNKEHYVLDRSKKLSIYNALLVCRKGNILLWKAIWKIALNVYNRYYGKSPLDPTGPVLLGNIILNQKMPLYNNIDLVHYSLGGYITYNNKFIIKTEYNSYNNDRKSMNENKGINYYALAWHNNHIYKY
jgi:mannosyltransferase OCH1-like enzyme